MAAMTLADIRAKYPAYANVPDQKLADAIYAKYYPQADRREFDARIGLNPYDNPLEAAGKALYNVPGQIGSQLLGAADAGLSLAGRVVEQSAPPQAAVRPADGGATSEDSGLNPQQILQRNKPWLKAGAGTFTTALSPSDEAKFQAWVGQNKVAFDPNDKTPDYDMRGFWKALQNGDSRAASAVDANDGKLHFPDYWKTPYDFTFSNESQFANQDAPRWTGDDKLVTPKGQVVWDDRAQKMGQTPVSGMDALRQQQQNSGQLLTPTGQPSMLSNLSDEQRQAAAETLAKAQLRGGLAQQQLAEGQQPLDVPPGVSPQGIVGGTISMVGQMAPAVAASLLTRSPAPMAIVGGLQGAGSTYTAATQGEFAAPGTPLVDPATAAQLHGFTPDEVAQIGQDYPATGIPRPFSAVTPEQAQGAAAQAGVVGAVGGMVSAGPLLAQGIGIFQRVLTEAAVNAGVSLTSEGLNMAIDQATTQPNLTPHEIVQNLAQAGLVGGVTGAVLGGAAGLAHGRAHAPEEPAVAKPGEAVPEPLPGAPVDDGSPIENSVALPPPLIAGLLPPPDTSLPGAARRPYADRPADIGTPISEPAPVHPPSPLPTLAPEEATAVATAAVQKTGQPSTPELVDTARQTLAPLGTFARDQLTTEIAAKVDALRAKTGRPADAPITVEDMAKAKVPQAQLDEVLATRLPEAPVTPLKPDDIRQAAAARNLIADDGNFADLAYRATGQRDIDRMTQVQLGAMQATLDRLPAHDRPTTVPIAHAPPFSEAQYGAALDALQQQGRYTAKALADATGLSDKAAVNALRDKMVERGQLVQRGTGDYRLYDVTGRERQATPDQLPEGAFTEHVVRQMPVDKVRIRQDGKSLGTFGSASEARDTISGIRQKEAANGGQPSALRLEPAADTAWGVLQNRYDRDGNLLGQAVVDTHRDEAGARKAADQLNRAPTEPRYTQENVAPSPEAPRSDTAAEPPRRPPAPDALAGRTAEILKRLNKLAGDRKLSMLGVRVSLKHMLATPDGQPVEGVYVRKLIAIAAEHLDAKMSDDQVVDALAQVMDHETIHALRQAGVLTPDTKGWQTILRYARRTRRPGESETYAEWAERNYKDIRGYENKETREEEAIAEAFRHWAKDRRSVVGAPATVFRQMSEWFRRLFSSIPDDAFKAIESGKMVEEAFNPPGMNTPRARAVRAMGTAKAGIAAAQSAKDENLARVRSREFMRARAQAREDRYGRAGPKTVNGTTASRTYATGDVADRPTVAAAVDRFKAQNGVTAARLKTYLPEDPGYMQRVARAQQDAVHNPDDPATAKAYRALNDETKAQYRALGPLEVTPWTSEGEAYKSPAEMLADIAAGKLKLRMSADMFGPGADNPGHPMNAPSGFTTKAGGAGTFKTSKGSVYTLHEDGTTTRTKSLHQGHDAADVGVKDRSTKTVYLDSEASNLSAAGSSMEKPRVVLKDGKATLVWMNRAEGRFGTSALSRDVPYHTEPAVGRFPLELWQPTNDVGGSEAYRGMHAGNPITELQSAGGGARALTHNDLFRVVHDVYGHGQSGFRGDPRGAYNAYHEHARLYSPEARRALATETLAQDAWADYGPHLQRKDGTVPRPEDIDYLPPSSREFARQKAALLPDELVRADPGWDVAAQADSAESPKFSVGSPAFKQWFGDSKVTNENGEPLRVFHGTNADFNSFDPARLGEATEAPSAKQGFFFASNPKVASSYADLFNYYRDTKFGQLAQKLTGGRYEGWNEALVKRFGGKSAIAQGANVMPVYLAVKNPKVVDFGGSEYRERSYNDIIAEAKAQGHDGVILRNTIDEGFNEGGDAATDVYVAFKPEQIKSSIGNRGTYDPGNADIRYSVGNDKFKDELPGGRLYGNPKKSPGGALSKPDTPSPEFSSNEPGNRFFGGQLADHQLAMARAGTRGTTMIYLTPEEFTRLAGRAENPEQPVYDQAVQAGYKLSSMPSLVLDGYAGDVRVVNSDGHAGIEAIGATAERIPVTIYSKHGKNFGLISALDGKDGRVPFPRDGRAENFPAERAEEPGYDVNNALGYRVPEDDSPPRFSLPDDPDKNIVLQRVEGRVMQALHGIGRSKRDIPVIGSVFDARVAFQDKMLAVKEMLEKVKAAGGDVNDANNTYMLEQLYHGKVFEEIEARQNNLHIPFVEALKAAHDGPLKIDPKDVEDYVYAQHAPERNAYLRTRGAPSPNPSGMSDAEAAAILDKLALNGKLPTVKALAEQLRKVTADTTRTRVEGGLISAKSAAASPYESYVPLRGFAEEDLDPEETAMTNTRARSGKGFTVGGKEDRSTTGRSRKAGDIIGHVFLQNTEAVIRAQKNQVAQSAMRLLSENPEAGIGEVLKTAPTRLVTGENGMIRESGDPSYRQQPDIITAKFDGKEMVARLSDPRAARAIKSDYVTSSNSFVQGLANLLGKFSRYQATINTSLSPDFLFKNPVRDALEASILGHQYDIKGFTGELRRNILPAMAGIREVLFAGTANSPMAQAYKELRAAGGTVEFMGIHDLETTVAKIRRQVVASGANPTLRQARDYLGHVGTFIEHSNKVLENGTRLAAYVAARKGGVSVPQAAFIAKNITVNFNKGGELKSVMNSLYLFYGAGVQGTSGVLNALKSRRVQMLVGGIVAAGATQDILNRMLLGGSTDTNQNGVPDYDEIPDYVLEHNMVLYDHTGVLASMGLKNPYVMLPLPQGFSWFWNLGRNLSASFSGSPVRSPGKAALNTMTSLVDAYNPLGGSSSFLNLIAPTFVDPFVDLATNRNFAGAPITPERPSYGAPTPQSQLYWSTTGEVPKAIADHINTLTGGSEHRSGWADFSPETLQYMTDYATGAVGTFAERMGSTAGKLAAGDFADIHVGDIPIARAFAGAGDQRQNASFYYDNLKSVLSFEADAKAAQKDGGVPSLIQRYPTEAKSAQFFNATEKSLSGLRQQLKAVQAATNIAPERQRALVQQIKQKQDAAMARANQMYFGAQGR